MEKVRPTLRSRTAKEQNRASGKLQSANRNLVVRTNSSHALIYPTKSSIKIQKCNRYGKILSELLLSLSCERCQTARHHYQQQHSETQQLHKATTDTSTKQCQLTFRQCLHEHHDQSFQQWYCQQNIHTHQQVKHRLQQTKTTIATSALFVLSCGNALVI